MALLARGKRAGLAEFGDSTDALLASLAPLIAFPLVGAGWTAVSGQPEAALLGFLARLAAVLALPVITHAFAQACGQEALWRRTATALNWSFWLILPVLLVAAIAGAVLETAGVSMAGATYAALAIMLVYVLWLQWFVVQAGLRIGVLQAMLLTVMNFFAMGVLTEGPALLGLVWRMV
jgi:hypothetical protein